MYSSSSNGGHKKWTEILWLSQSMGFRVRESSQLQLRLYFFLAPQIAQVAQPVLFTWVGQLGQSGQQQRNIVKLGRVAQNQNSVKEQRRKSGIGGGCVV